jgi:hypothetical protein
MMVYIVPKQVKGHTYLYLHRSFRVRGKVKTQYVAYLGKAEKYRVGAINEIIAKHKGEPIDKADLFKIMLEQGFKYDYSKGKKNYTKVVPTHEGFIEPDYRRGEIILESVRAGSEFGDPSRGGTWYSVYKYEGYKSMYADQRRPSYEVGGKEIHRRRLYLRNPYYFDFEGYDEGTVVLGLAEEVIDEIDDVHEFISEMQEQVLEMNVEEEMVFADLEKQISEKLKKEGYDSIIIYHSFPYRHEIHPDQVFKLK